MPETRAVPQRQKPTERGLTAAAEILTRWQAERELSPLDRVVDLEFRSRRYLNSGERRWIGDAVYGVVRYLRRQQAVLAALHLPETPEHLVRVWADFPAGEEAVAAIFPHTPPLAMPETYAAAMDALPKMETPRDYLRVTLSFPDALAAELETLLGEEAPAAALAFNRAAPVTVRVNTLKMQRERIRERLPEACPAQYSPDGLHLPRRVNWPDVPGFREGFIEPQEEASQIAARLSGAGPGQVVVDVGAGAGGKTLALAAAMRNSGRLIALDIAERRMEELLPRARRAGVSCLEPLVVKADNAGQWSPSGQSERTLQALQGSADCVFLDAPCTGSGVLRRAPDTKWRENDMEEFARLQNLLLAQSSELVKPGGVLTYVTCAIEAAQNERVIASFLGSEAGRAFSVDALPAEFAPFASGNYFRSWPHRHGLDAFFAARLRRQVQGLGVRC